MVAVCALGAPAGAKTAKAPAVFDATLAQYIKTWNTVQLPALASAGQQVKQMATPTQKAAVYGAAIQPGVTLYLVAPSPTSKLSAIAIGVSGEGATITPPVRVLAAAMANLFPIADGTNLAQIYLTDADPAHHTLPFAKPIPIGSYGNLHSIVRGRAVLFVFTRIGRKAPAVLKSLFVQA